MNLNGPVAALRGYSERQMVDRATVERNTGGAGDPYGGTSPAWTGHLADQRCKVWFSNGRTAVDENRSVVVAGWAAAFPLGTDVLPGDRITAVAGPDGTQRLPETLYVDHVGDERTQLVCTLERRS